MVRPQETRPETPLAVSEDSEHALELFSTEASATKTQPSPAETFRSTRQAESAVAAAPTLELHMDPPRPPVVDPLPRLTLASEPPLFTHFSYEPADLELHGQGPPRDGVRQSRSLVWPLLSAPVAIFLVSWFAIGGSSSQRAAIDAFVRLRAAVTSLAAVRPVSEDSGRVEPKAAPRDDSRTIVTSGMSTASASGGVPPAAQSPSPTPPPAVQPSSPTPPPAASQSARAAVPSAPPPPPRAAAASESASTSTRTATAKNAIPSKTQAPTVKTQAQPAAARDTLVGTLSIDSRPVGASVFIDDRLIGTTPLMVPNIERGKHSIRLQLNAHREWRSTVDVLPDVQNRITAGLEEDENSPRP
jgi:hypothetical protein